MNAHSPAIAGVELLVILLGGRGRPLTGSSDGGMGSTDACGDGCASEVAAWEAPRNQEQVRVQWRLTIGQARIKLHKVYPEIRN